MFHKWFILSILLGLYISFANGQNKTIIVNSKTKQAIAYVIVKTKDIFVTTNDSGFFSAKAFNSKDTVVISNIGYQSLKISVNQISDTIFLRREATVLDEVVVNASNNFIKTVSNFTDKAVVRHVGDVAGVERVEKIAFLSEDSGMTKLLTEIKIRMRLARGSNLCRLHIYESDANGLPGKELLPENVFITKDDIKNKTATINISDLGIYTTSNNIFVGIEYIGNVFHDQGLIVYTTESEDRTIIYETTHYSDASLYVRTVFYRDWTLLDDPVGNKDNPVNMMISVTYQ